MSPSTSTIAAPADSSSPSSSSFNEDLRPPKVDVSALSPSEYPPYTTWLRKIAKSPSGVEELLDEQDALAWLRRECAISRVDEVRMLSLFERYPLGLEPGHFYALLRLVAWIQQGHAPARPLIFTQTVPPMTGLAAGTNFPLPALVRAAAASGPDPSPPQRRVSSGPPTKLTSFGSRAQSAIASQQQQPSVSTPSSKVPPPALTETQSPSASHLPLPLLPVPSTGTTDSTAAPVEAALQRSAALSVLPPPVPSESTKPNRGVVSATANPFREKVHQRSTSLVAQPATDPLLGFDPAPILLKPGKPKVVRPTPIVATAGQPNPVTSAADATTYAVAGETSAFSARSVKSVENGTSPPLPPRPADTEKPPPPLPPRAYISPLIQAGLQASKQVRQQKDALPPKTFTVLQSSTPRSKREARLLTGESAPADIVAELPPPPTHHAKRKVSGHEGKRSVSEATAGLIGLRKTGSDDGQEGPQRAVSHTATVIAAPKPSRPSHSRHHLKGRGSESASGGDGSHHQSSVVVPKAQYLDSSGSSRTKPPTLPSWLREQEQLQRSALAEGKPMSPPLGTRRQSHHASEAQQRKDFILNFERSRHEPTVLDDEFDVFPTELSEQASRAASIDRPHNPFLHRSSQAEAEKLRLQPLLRQHHNHLERERQKERDRLRETDERGSLRSRSPEANRPLGRSKTLHGKGPPPPPLFHSASRKRLESFPATLNSGTYAGYGRAGQGGLRLMPPSAKADVGIRAEEEPRRPIAHRGTSALSVSDRSSAADPTSCKGDEDSGETSLNSTNPTSVQELAQSVERRVSNSTQSKPRSSNGGSFSLKEKVTDFLKLQDGPPNGARPIDELKRDAIRLAERRGWINRRGEESLLREDEEEEGEQETDHSQNSIRRRQSSASGGHWQQQDGSEVEGDESDERWDDAPMPDDTYSADTVTVSSTVVTDTSDTPTPTIGEASSERSRDSHLPPPRRSASTGMPSSSANATAPIARRPSGYVARRASRIEARGTVATPLSRNGSGSGGGAWNGSAAAPSPASSGLGRAASFSVRSGSTMTSNKRNQSDYGGGGDGGGTVSDDHPEHDDDSSVDNGGHIGKRASWFEGSSLGGGSGGGSGGGGGVDQRWKNRFLLQQQQSQPPQQLQQRQPSRQYREDGSQHRPSDQDDDDDQQLQHQAGLDGSVRTSMDGERGWKRLPE